MAISVYLVLCVGMLTVNVCAGIQFGRCNDTFFLTKATSCEHTFYRILVSSSSLHNCSQMYKVHVYDCYKETLLQCYRDAITNWQLHVRVGLLTLDAFGQAQFYCSTNKTAAKLSEMPDEVRKHFPCSNKYLEEGQNCADKVRSILVKNPRDPALCREYSRSVLCTQRVAKAHCNTTIEIPEDLGVNPFCPKILVKDNGKENGTEVASTQPTEDKREDENAEAVVFETSPCPCPRKRTTTASFADVPHLACGGWLLIAMLCFLSCNV